ncbi:hypothetical protein [uncultured Sphingomonas sp.]|uniref:hypothetical protein n=1 Tax=uncultured Sphingomonas sp. TaxID=158754 RepID=UPI00261AB5F2|nr:hypothetical protein [uncultured Sphingomonas sp.]
MIVALVAAAAAVAPAIGATEVGQRTAKKVAAAAATARFSSSFTPSAADPRLAAVFARGGLDGADVGEFRFTPAETRQGNRAVTVAVRARSTRTGDGTTRFAANAATVGIAPIAYNLGAAIGWQRFAVSGDISRVDVGPQPGSRESADVAVSYSLNRFTGRVKATADRPLAGAPKAIDNNSSYAIDVGGSYSLTRNIDLTAGVRYKSERERLTQFTDDRRDSQAVYVGTAFRF